MTPPRLNAQQLQRALERAGADTRTLDERMAAVQAELEDVPRRGHATITTRNGGEYSYDYITEADLMAGIRPLLAKHGVAVYYSDELLGVDSGMARVRVTLRLRAHGDELTLTGDGVGTDLGDKHANKAKTAAVRYLLWKTFLQPSDEDPEQENIDATDAQKAQEARERADRIRQGEQTRRTDRTTAGADTKPRLLERISQLSVELDEVQGTPPGRALSDIQSNVQMEQGIPMSELDTAALVAIGRALADHVTSERAAAERDGLTYTPTTFTLPKGE